MSEYQYYEFRAIDRALTPEQVSQLRAISTRAQITPRKFTNFYTFGDFKGDPVAMMQQYFDAFVYTANWGTHRLMLRLPRAALDAKTIAPFGVPHALELHRGSEQLILDFFAEEEEPTGEEGGDEWLTELAPLRGELARKDLRSLYLGWLAAAQAGLLEDDVVEPPIPAGLRSLTEAQKSLVEFLRIDDDLLNVAREPSGELTKQRSRSDDLERQIRQLSATEKQKILVELAAGDPEEARALLSQGVGQLANPLQTAAAVTSGGRTVGSLLSAAGLPPMDE